MSYPELRITYLHWVLDLSPLQVCLWAILLQLLLDTAFVRGAIHCTSSSGLDDREADDPFGQGDHCLLCLWQAGLPRRYLLHHSTGLRASFR